MQMVIDISKEIYKRFNREYWAKDLISPYVAEVVLNAFTKGIVLPEEHGRLIDADDINNHIVGSVDTRDCPTIIEADKADKEGS